MSYGQGPVVFPNMDALLKVSNNMPVGTMAYVADQEYAYLRVGQGWRYIQVCQSIFLPHIPGVGGNLAWERFIKQKP